MQRKHLADFFLNKITADNQREEADLSTSIRIASGSRELFGSPRLNVSLHFWCKNYCQRSVFKIQDCSAKRGLFNSQIWTAQSSFCIVESCTFPKGAQSTLSSWEMQYCNEKIRQVNSCLTGVTQTFPNTFYSIVDDFIVWYCYHLSKRTKVVKRPIRARYLSDVCPIFWLIIAPKVW